ncbi:MAG TPA: ATP-binding cassette domain-containing protein, partial [Steroidobacteraceae bacterium]
MIEVEQLHKTFGVKIAVEDVTFSARDGQITGLLGPNGAGKTTTLRMLYTLLKPERGRIMVDGLDAALQPLEVRRRLGVLPDARGLYKRLTARENIAYFAQLHGMDEPLIRRRSNALIQALAMQDIAERRVEGFSQGERVKTAIARALVHDPRHIVLDEPSNGLDVIATLSLRDFLRQLEAEG